MNWIFSDRGNRLARIAGRLAIVALPAVLILGCSDSDHGSAPVTAATVAVSTRTPVHTATPTATPPNADAQAACAKLNSCNQCFSSANGQCITTDACAQRLSADSAICINGVNGCGTAPLGDCVFLGCDGGDATGQCQ